MSRAWAAQPSAWAVPDRRQRQAAALDAHGRPTLLLTFLVEGVGRQQLHRPRRTRLGARGRGSSRGGGRARRRAPQLLLRLPIRGHSGLGLVRCIKLGICQLVLVARARRGGRSCCSSSALRAAAAAPEQAARRERGADVEV